MDAQVEYLVEELQARPGLNAALNAAGLTIDEASDDIVYLFEIPGTLLDASKHKRPRTDPAVQAEFARRRPRAHAAMRAFQAAHPSP